MGAPGHMTKTMTVSLLLTVDGRGVYTCEELSQANQVNSCGFLLHQNVSTFYSHSPSNFEHAWRYCVPKSVWNKQANNKVKSWSFLEVDLERREEVP
jgi:hypothetical protein